MFDRFKSAPIGRWSQASGTFSNVMDELWEFRPDHTGTIVAQQEIRFEWKEVADFTIACREEEDEEWAVIRYGFKRISTDCGEVMALCEISADGAFQQGFWLSVFPLMKIET